MRGQATFSNPEPVRKDNGMVTSNTNKRRYSSLSGGQESSSGCLLPISAVSSKVGESTVQGELVCTNLPLSNTQQPQLTATTNGTCLFCDNRSKQRGETSSLCTEHRELLRAYDIKDHSIAKCYHCHEIDYPEVTCFLTQRVCATTTVNDLGIIVSQENACRYWCVLELFCEDCSKWTTVLVHDGRTSTSFQGKADAESFVKARSRGAHLYRSSKLTSLEDFVCILAPQETKPVNYATKEANKWKFALDELERKQQKKNSPSDEAIYSELADLFLYDDDHIVASSLNGNNGEATNTDDMDISTGKFVSKKARRDHTPKDKGTSQTKSTTEERPTSKAEAKDTSGDDDEFLLDPVNYDNYFKRRRTVGIKNHRGVICETTECTRPTHFHMRPKKKKELTGAERRQAEKIVTCKASKLLLCQLDWATCRSRGANDHFHVDRTNYATSSPDPEDVVIPTIVPTFSEAPTKVEMGVNTPGTVVETNNTPEPLEACTSPLSPAEVTNSDHGSPLSSSIENEVSQKDDLANLLEEINRELDSMDSSESVWSEVHSPVVSSSKLNTAPPQAPSIPPSILPYPNTGIVTIGFETFEWKDKLGKTLTENIRDFLHQLWDSAFFQNPTDTLGEVSLAGARHLDVANSREYTPNFLAKILGMQGYQRHAAGTVDLLQHSYNSTTRVEIWTDLASKVLSSISVMSIANLTTGADVMSQFVIRIAFEIHKISPLYYNLDNLQRTIATEAYLMNQAVQMFKFRRGSTPLRLTSGTDFVKRTHKELMGPNFLSLPRYQAGHEAPGILG